jgi:hypothetical protein
MESLFLLIVFENEDHNSNKSKSEDQTFIIRESPASRLLPTIGGDGVICPAHDYVRTSSALNSCPAGRTGSWYYTSGIQRQFVWY